MSGRSTRSGFIELGGWLLLLVLLVWNFRELAGFTPISPILASREGEVDGQLFVPNQKSPALIVGLAVLFLVMRVGRLRESYGRGDALGSSVALLLFGLGIGTWSHYTGELALGVVALSLALMGTAGVLGGRQALVAIRLPALLLLLAVPIPGVLLNTIVYPMQLATAASTSALLDLLGVANVVYGDTIHTQQAVFQVIEGCSGLRAMETLLMTAIVYQALLPHSRLASWLLILSAPLFGALINQIRVLSIVLDPEASSNQDHTVQGLVMTVAGVLLVTAFSLVLERWLPASEVDAELAGERGDDASAQASWGSRMRRIALVAGLLAVSIAAGTGARFEIHRPEHRGPNQLPGRFADWRAEVEQLDDQFLGSTHYPQSAYRTYRREGEEVRVLLGVDARRKPLLSGVSPKIHALGQGWRTLEREPVEVAGGGVAAFGSVQQSEEQFAWVVSWEQGTDPGIGEILRNFLALDRSPWQRPYSATAVQISTPMADSSATARAAARARIQPVVDLLLETFPPP